MKGNDHYSTKIHDVHSMYRTLLERGSGEVTRKAIGFAKPVRLSFGKERAVSFVDLVK